MGKWEFVILLWNTGIFYNKKIFLIFRILFLKGGGRRQKCKIFQNQLVYYPLLLNFLGLFEVHFFHMRKVPIKSLKWALPHRIRQTSHIIQSTGAASLSARKTTWVQSRTFIFSLPLWFSCCVYLQDRKGKTCISVGRGGSGADYS